MRITKEQVEAALKLLGLEFEDKEIDLMLRRANSALYSYEALRKVDIPYDTEPAFHFQPGLPDRVPIKGPQRFETTIPKASAKAPSNLEDVAFWRVTELAPLVRARAVSSTELTKMYLERMKKYSPKLLCLVTLTEDVALEQAAEADREIKAGRYRGPLHGIPFGVKDLFDTKGIPTTWGAEPFQQRVPDYDATVIERLRKQGAVLMAKLSMGALAQGDVWFQGRTNNPWSWDEKTQEYTRGSSGSSAGSACSTSAGLVGFSLGTETLGSIVSPSGVCGTAGLRPTYGRISRHGAMALSWTMDKIGPICRGVEDLAIVLNAVYGPDGHDRSVAADPFHWEPKRPLSSLKVGVAQKAFDNARSELLYGEWLRRHRRRVDARAHLRAALEIFQQLAAAPWEARARAELRASGETARKRDPSTRDQLTPQELQISRLVASGKTNPEVAAQLFLSPRTIDYHLRKVFSKLGIASRTELVRHGLPTR